METKVEDAEAEDTPASSLAPADAAAETPGNEITVSPMRRTGDGGEVGSRMKPWASPSPSEFEGRFMCNSFGPKQTEVRTGDCQGVVKV